ncbi:hypothetical protein KC333_g2406 [Hortaea werneckii]|nr:hypothetical protein KC333_g2406 [Hortaea werneckii]KAI7319826.1 hypothetical protein KC326_g2988 [Hortaea werneckii]
MTDHFEKLAMRALDDCKTLLGEEQASTGAVRDAKSGRPHAKQQGRPSQLDEGDLVHKTLSKSMEGISLLDINYRRRSALWFRRGLIIKVTNAHESSSRRYSGNSDDATEVTDIVDGVSKTGAYRQTQAEAGRDPPELLPGEEPRAGEDPMQEPIAVESARYGQSLDVSARLLWTQVYKVGHGVETALFGKVREGWQLKVEVLFETLNPNSTLKHTARPKYRRGDWVQFASKGAGQTVTRWQVSEAHLSLGQWKYSLVDPDTGKHAQAETIGQSGSSLMILEDV